MNVIWGIGAVIYILYGFFTLKQAGKYFQKDNIDFQTFTTFLYNLIIGSSIVLVGLFMLSIALGVLK